ncbi:MAG: SufD family Fe-S cluster assembly protein [Gammaproteobacteria bacterium]|nr:SufD family Fe-S cluster assembly protein [Gammaproteobacteria bacterium]MYD81180.1 SufD family Fe-S cluster assembly protein [Gammaproteobacteria bacterium]
MDDRYPASDTTISTRIDRDKAVAAINDLGLPKYRTEHWKYTNPKPIIEELRESPSACPVAPTRIEGEVEILPFDCFEAKKAISEYVGSIAVGGTSSMPSLNLLNLTTGYVIRSTDSKGSVPAVKIHPSPTHCERILILVEEGASLKVIESSMGGNRVIECIVQENARLVHTRLQEATNSVEYGALSVQVNSNASYVLDQYSTGTSLRRNEITVDVLGEESSVEIKGGWNLESKSHLDSQVCVNHLVPRSRSQVKFHGVAGDDSRSVFNGRLYIARDAQHTSAHLTNKNILTGENAEIYTKPELEIYADDVVCSHGATSGQLDEDQVFYMRTRGLPNARARELLLNGFLQEVIDDELGSEILGLKPLNLV